MLQLATREVCLLVRIGQMGRPLPPTLSALLAAEAPVKVTHPDPNPNPNPNPDPNPNPSLSRWGVSQLARL
jgi:hypothetical protein